MRFLMDGFEFSDLGDILPMVLLTAFVPSLLAWGWSVWVCRRDAQVVPWRRALVAFVGAFVICFATLSWTPEPGDYSVPQVVVSGILMVILTVLLVFGARPRIVASVLSLWGLVLGFALAWSLIVGWADVTGLWVVGLLALYTGLLVGLTIVIAITQIIDGYRESQRASKGESK